MLLPLSSFVQDGWQQQSRGGCKFAYLDARDFQLSCLVICIPTYVRPTEFPRAKWAHFLENRLFRSSWFLFPPKDLAFWGSFCTSAN